MKSWTLARTVLKRAFWRQMYDERDETSDHAKFVGFHPWSLHVMRGREYGQRYGVIGDWESDRDEDRTFTDTSNDGEGNLRRWIETRSVSKWIPSCSSTLRREDSEDEGITSRIAVKVSTIRVGRGRGQIAWNTDVKMGHCHCKMQHLGCRDMRHGDEEDAVNENWHWHFVWILCHQVKIRGIWTWRMSV